MLTIDTKLVKANGAPACARRQGDAVAEPGEGRRRSGSPASGVSLAAKTNAKGVATVGVKTTKAGIIRVRITNVKACNTARIGVVGVFQPPVTG